MDSLDVADKHYDRKVLDLQRRYDEQYDRIEEIELGIDELKKQIQSIRQEKVSGDNIYQLLLMFDKGRRHNFYIIAAAEAGKAVDNANPLIPAVSE